MESRHVNFVPSDEVDDSKVIENVDIHSEISGIVEDPLVNLGTTIIDKSRSAVLVTWIC